VESLPQSEVTPPTVDDRRSAALPAATGDPPHLTDPRALQILSTEHWGQLTQRSLVYNETFSRGVMFLTFLSASLVALGFVYQGSGPDFIWILIAILVLDLFVGLATLGRLHGASLEELHALQAMNRIRHAYVELVPTLDPYLPHSPYDDAASVLSIYGPSPGGTTMLGNVRHGLTTMPGLIAVLDAVLIGTLAGAFVAAAGGEVRVALIGGIVGVLLAFVMMTTYTVRLYANWQRGLVARFPAPDSATEGQPPGRRNT
jgi:hypothetical protein